ncbi:prolyl 4-hydroxylase subunit alpha-2-like [Drosophila santomea]|uniref:prolyl 4-hydroxylase subunit alpha-2-like n=1 Tax=Drosophila santomea TaxID=129105 RepID=UPI001954620F|nr:prolyl 4-hydroxylase subunit alpha-2-like [Drosophila santomea]XP_039493325.1 prolyl 4-hydroxylase subunit alpha-2-like [Drosophila santomea]XP_043862290.1 prolyl 4-hydroxylase subunit alpha-2-like [Drosophila santomea]
MRSSKWLLPVRLLLIYQVLLLLHHQVAGEESHCTSVAGMVKLLDLEAQLIDNLEDYAVELEKKLETVRRSITTLRLENDKARSSTEEYLSNPLNSFSLIRRMNRDWIIWQLYLDDSVGVSQVERIQELREHMPTHTDVEEAVSALDRIQHTYGLKVSEMTHGLLNGKQYNVSLTVLDTYAMAQILFDQENYLAAASWIYQSVVLMEVYSLAAPLQISKNEVRMFYAETLLKLNQNADALKVVNIALADNPQDIKLLLKKSEIETMIRTGANIAHPVKVQAQAQTAEPSAYQMGCRGQFAPSADSKLHCLYNRTTSPFLMLAPLKMELVGLDPYMVLYHDVLSAKEIKELQGMATPGLKRATVFQAASGRNEVVKTRTSKVAWFPDGYSPLTVRLNARITDMTGFNLYGSEMLQLMNYGLGGHYDQHYDYFNTINSNLTAMSGDRIATVLFYLTDVEQGGATVFPNIRKAIFPQRGSVIMWYNLKDDGQIDTQTLHAACPVIVGSKWVCNKWIREREQLFRRPCLKKRM